jgi:hypothetical protein
MRGCDEEIFVHEAMCVEKARDKKQFIDPGQEKGGCARNPL